LCRFNTGEETRPASTAKHTAFLLARNLIQITNSEKQMETTGRAEQ
jgi:hypothetical protein